ncbi:hypothetical protein BH20ACT19_BH20ACT19_04470 [soil metagenome]
MNDDGLMQAVRELRAEGRSPKEIARALGVRPAAVAPLVRTIAAEGGAPRAPEPEPFVCWVSPGWRVGLSVEGHPEWPDGGSERPEASGLVSVLVAREDRKAKVSVCGYLLDVYCLGVKDALGPQRMHRGELAGFVRSYFGAWAGGPSAAPIELARHLVFGALDYARGLGFGPHPDFERARRHLGPWAGPSAIGFGRDGTPHFTAGPYDDGAAVLRRLEQAVGSGNFHFVVSVGDTMTM